jgi:hypothetical protein
VLWSSRATKRCRPGPTPFYDDNGTVHEANINKAAAAGFANGFRPGQYNPLGPVGRDQMPMFLSRVLNRPVDLGDTVVPVEQIGSSGRGRR